MYNFEMKVKVIDLPHFVRRQMAIWYIESKYKKGGI